MPGEAPRHFLSVLAGENAPAFRQGSGRLELAQWLTRKDNPLTARVIVNRFWLELFGVGIVAVLIQLTVAGVFTLAEAGLARCNSSSTARKLRSSATGSKLALPMVTCTLP